MLTHTQYIAAHLAAALPDIQWIDRDKGQLDNPEAFHSLLVPALLLGFGPVEWEGLSRGRQLGQLSLTVSLVTRLPPATHHPRPLGEYDHAADLAAALHQALATCIVVKDRRASRDYFTPEFYVMETTYDMTVGHALPPRTIPKPPPTIDATLKLPLP